MTSFRHPLHDAFVEVYDNRASSYDHEPGSWHSRLAADVVKWAKPALKGPLKSPAKVLDLCCGTGMVTFAALNEFGPDTIVHGVDISAKSLEIARGKANPNQKVEFYHGSAAELEALPLEKSSYSLIICCSAIVLLPSDVLRLFRLWATYLKPGGVLVFDAPVRDDQIILDSLSRVVRAFKNPDISVEWVQSISSVKKVLEEANYDVVDVFRTDSYRNVELRAENLGVTWDNAIRSPTYGFQKLSTAEREDGRNMFLKMMKDKANQQGVVRDECRFFIGIAKKNLKK